MEFAKMLEEKRISLPPAPVPAANYVPWVRSGNLVHVAGQVPPRGPSGGFQYVGKLGQTWSLAEGQLAARLVALNVLAQLNVACGGDENHVLLEKVVRVVKLNGFINCTPDFTDQPLIMNAASDLMVDVFGKERGSHARSAVGVVSLPFGVAVEIDGIFEVLL